MSRKNAVADIVLVLISAAIVLSAACSRKAEAKPVLYKFTGPALTQSGQVQPNGSIKHYVGRFIAGADTVPVVIQAAAAMSDTNLTPVFEAPAFVPCVFEVYAVDQLNRAGLPIRSDSFQYDPGKPGPVPAVIRFGGGK